MLNEKTTKMTGAEAMAAIKSASPGQYTREEIDALWAAVYEAEAAKHMKRFRAAERKARRLAAALDEKGYMKAVQSLERRSYKAEIRCWQPAAEEADATVTELRGQIPSVTEAASKARREAREVEIRRLEREIRSKAPRGYEAELRLMQARGR